jgi:hypothetical protein
MADKKAPSADPGRTLDALLAHAPDRKTWSALTALLDGLPAARLPAALKKVTAVVARWPLGLRSMPQGWWASTLAGKAEARAALARRRTLWSAGKDGDPSLGTYALQVDASPDLSTFVTADAAAFPDRGGDLVLREGLTGQPRAVLLAGGASRSEVHALAYSPDGRFIAAAPITAGTRGSVRLWDAHSGALLWSQELDPRSPERALRFDDEPVVDDEGPAESVSLAFSPSGKQLWSASRRLGRLRCWDVATGASHAELPDEPAVATIAISPNGHLLATGSETGWLRVWDLRDETLVAETRASEKPLRAVTFSANSRKVASAGRSLDLFKLDVETLVKLRSRPLAARGDAIAGAFSLVALPTGAIRSATIVHGGVVVRDLPGRAVRRIKLGSGLESIRLSRDGARLLAANTQRVRLFWLPG